MEVTVKSKTLSPMTSLLVSFSFVIGILVVDLTQARIVPTARAQDGSQKLVTGAAFGVANATIRGRINASGVVVNGVATDAVFDGKVAVVNSVVVSDGAIALDGINVSGQSPTPQPDGINVSGQSPGPQPDGINVSGQPPAPPPDGINVSGQSPTQGGTIIGGQITAAGDLQIAGGVVTGNNLRVDNGVIRGGGLTISGALISGSGLRISGASVVSPAH
jgi:hypothetical protein